MLLDQKTANKLREEYPNHIPLQVAAKFLGVSPRQLSKLIAEGREPFCFFSANIGTKQRYCRVYTERFIAFMNGELPQV